MSAYAKREMSTNRPTVHVVLNRNYYMMTSLDDPDLKNIVFLSMLALGMSNNKNTRFFKSGISPDIIK